MKLEEMLRGRTLQAEKRKQQHAKESQKGGARIKKMLQRLGFCEKDDWQLDVRGSAVFLRHPQLPKPLWLIEYEKGLLDYSKLDSYHSMGYYAGPGMTTQEEVLGALERMQHHYWTYDLD